MRHDICCEDAGDETDKHCSCMEPGLGMTQQSQPTPSDLVAPLSDNELTELRELLAKYITLENPRPHEYDAYKAAQAWSDLDDKTDVARLLATIDARDKVIEQQASALKAVELEMAEKERWKEHWFNAARRNAEAIQAVEQLCDDPIRDKSYWPETLVAVSKLRTAIREAKGKA